MSALPLHSLPSETVRARPSRDDSVVALVHAARKGDARAWDAIVQRFGGTIRAVTRGMRLSAADADDVAQTTWLRLLQNIDRLQDPGAIKAWLITTARREALRSLQGGTREFPTADPILEERADPMVVDEHVAQAERGEALRAALDDLPERARTLLEMLVDKPECSYDELSSALGIPVGSIGPTRGRSLQRLRANRRLVWAVA